MLRRLVSLFWLLNVALLLLAPTASAQGESPLVLVLTAAAPVAPPMVEYIARGVQTAEQRNAEMLIIQLNTPGGDTVSMGRVVETILASNVPVVVYVQPRGGMAASAGTFITLAGHASAMAPETTIGAASPVGGEGQDLGETLETKLKEDFKAQARNLTARRGPRAIEFAQLAVEEARAATAEEAYEMGLVDFVALDLSDLLQKLNGFTVVINGSERVLHTANATVVHLSISFIESLLSILTNPNVVFLLLTIGVQALLIELSSPGGWVSGFIGVVCLALATYGLGVLPVNWFGIVFVIMAFVLFVLDVKAPTHGGLTLAGVISLVVGALVLFNTPSATSFQRVSLPLVIGVAFSTSAIFFTILTFVLRAQKNPLRMGQETLAGRTGAARSEIAPRGNVQLGGELWSAELAEGEAPIPKGARVEVVRAEGVRLYVRQLRANPPK